MKTDEELIQEMHQPVTLELPGGTVERLSGWYADHHRQKFRRLPPVLLVNAIEMMLNVRCRIEVAMAMRTILDHINARGKDKEVLEDAADKAWCVVDQWLDETMGLQADE